MGVLYSLGKVVCMRPVVHSTDGDAEQKAFYFCFLQPSSSGLERYLLGGVDPEFHLLGTIIPRHLPVVRKVVIK